ncbi:MAG TPA: hypothetical protein VHS55_05995 [Solirubrobacteraceae bacterium]|jgi:hypothetical protein|nr:hypothetical protein [Solirubrobacteraceae bacterium]
MRTTVTLDQDVASKLRQVARERGVSFKAALNEALRTGLRGGSQAARRYRMPVRDMGVRKGIDLDRALTLAAELEDVEILRKLELRK